ncbi:MULTISPECIES: nicotinate-nucleotide--dimethylbenzimidazole phosphoribosyltransferase [unclassified Tenacibaculum]|uniref:nicotinate-nucleotide--dimethylbenzimidazole phosphoribosyltransferase n=1 Tax=unclassified Tenacibaculum TaxID=2635139 RepID=UPI001F3CAA4A|nr:MULTISPECIES: nicotinate-nucleotide--dimethylbenzimidazole phosphoribosyltransferase [unclassified Tenacibaculum]MCF2873896.1 nicotinate-nucleotide--dimethylbenzimidazole phosphoribosyltransferase [Tenacibaculum sp. Cn5-1]MCF2936706.1 nicotinate-nucleotide--dimethylbenzimidazole phosphoribosyltransferase [Tenacibaculum sp. Cn5-34]MCG7512930.1 nicotinate-nucleotide--dimethylbenzimidazole phosphoribosyltransferase [Tenacibaculum sp. Cn5-46]
MYTTNITPLSKNIKEQLQEKIDFKTKPIGSLGVLENIALQIGLIQNTVSPTLEKPSIVVFAGDHGIVNSSSVTPYPQEVTQQMVYNFLNNGAAINVFCNQNNIQLKIVDAGVNANFETSPNLIDAKISKGTKDYSIEKAMNTEECLLALEKGKLIVQEIFKNGTNVIGFGEMGIGNTSAASLLMSYFTTIPIEQSVGKGTGLNDEGVIKKAEILRKTFDLHINQIQSPIDALSSFGGFEIVMMCGAILEAASLKMTILIDGFIVTSALLAAQAIDKNVLDYCIFCHTSGEQGHEKMLDFLKVKPLLNLGLRLGEGTGAAIAFPIVKSAISFLNEMATFKSANVSEA